MRFSLIAAALVASTLSAPAQAGVFADDLSRCFVNKSSDADRTTSMRWMFSAIASHPAFAAASRLTPADQAQANRDMSALFSRLMLRDCRKETVAAIKNEGESALKAAGEALGGAAINGIFSAPSVAAQLENFAAGLDEKAFADLSREAGIEPAKEK